LLCRAKKNLRDEFSDARFIFSRALANWVFDGFHYSFNEDRRNFNNFEKAFDIRSGALTDSSC
jgi:hypothetical protein